VKDLCMTEDLLKEDTRRLLLFSTSSDGDLRGWAFNPDNVRIKKPLILKPKQYSVEIFTCQKTQYTPPNILSLYR